MDCRTTPDLVTRSLSGNASVQDEAQLRGHLASCPACTALERGLSATWTLMGRLPALSSSAGAPAPAARPLLSRRPVWTAAAAAAAILVVAAVALSLRTHPAPLTPDVPVARDPQVPVAPPLERRETAVAPVLPGPVENLRPPVPVVAPLPEDPKTVAVPDAPAPKPPSPEAPDRKDVLVKPTLPDTRPEVKPAPPAPVPAPAVPLPVVATLSRVDGEVFSLSGASRTLVQAGQKLTSSDALETAVKGGQAELLFDDGTRVVLEADTLVDALQADGGKRLTLKRGQLKAKIAKQPAGEAMIFSTATAEARVLGTRLSLSVANSSTRLDVREGRVRIMRRDDSAWVDVSADHFVVVGKGLTMTPKPAAARALLHETFDLPRWGGAWLQGGEANLGMRLAIENGSLSMKTLQKPAQDVAVGKMSSDTTELARKALKDVTAVGSLSRKDCPRSAWLETRQAFGFSNEAPLRIRTRTWNSHNDGDRIAWCAINRGVPGQGISLERRGGMFQLWVDGATAPVWKKDVAAVQEWETLELWISKDQMLVRRNEETLYVGANPLKVKGGTLSLGVNAKMELAQDEEVRFDDVDIIPTTRAELEEVSR